MFKREWVMHYDGTPTDVAGGTNRYLLVDPSSGKRSKAKTKNDYTSMWVVGLGQDQNYYVLDMVRDRMNLTARAQKLMELHRKWRPKQTRYEDYGMQADIEHIRYVQGQENYRFEITPVGGAVAKEERIKRVVPLFEARRIWFPNSMHRTDHTGSVRDLVSDFIEQEFLAFPVAIHDDMLDSLARIEEPELPLIWPKQSDQDGDKPARYASKAGRESAWAV